MRCQKIRSEQAEPVEIFRRGAPVVTLADHFDFTHALGKMCGHLNAEFAGTCVSCTQQVGIAGIRRMRAHRDLDTPAVQSMPFAVDGVPGGKISLGIAA
ncbi:hypothetical protein D3C73_595630 [compost metagenome]